MASRHSPGHASNTSVASEPADSESIPTISKTLSTSKRKNDSLSDDEIEIAEEAVHVAFAMKGKHKAGSKGKGKRR